MCPRADVRVPLEKYWRIQVSTCASASETLQKQVKALESANMDPAYPREGCRFEEYFNTDRDDLIIYSCVCEEELLGFAISCGQYLYELHAAYWRHGIGSRLLGAVAVAHQSLSLHVHSTNTRARAFYFAMGFALQPSPVSLGRAYDMLLMQKNYSVPLPRCTICLIAHAARSRVCVAVRLCTIAKLHESMTADFALVLQVAHRV